ncbi:MAG: O-antigen ligase family protein [Candidatus Krumholzibacteria bacterium]|nr:O-antigen ligase family protein [Candidatus Krumholzibacteria bacterium]
MEIVDRPLNLRRLIVLALILGAGVAALMLVIPANLRKLLILGVIVSPAILFLFTRPRVLFYILTFFIFSKIYWYVGFSLFEITYIFAFVSWAVWALEKRRLVVHDPLFVSLVAAFCLLLFVSLVAARDIDSSIYRLKHFVQLMAFLFLTMQFVGERKEFRIFLIIVALAAVTNNFLPMIITPPEIYSAPSIIASQGVIRFEGLLFEPNLLAFLQIFVIPIFLFYMFMYRRPRIVRPAALLAIIGSIAIIVLSFSRGGFISLVFLLLVLFYLERRNRILLGFGIVLIVVGLILVPPSYYIRIGSIFNALSASGKDYPIFTRLQTMKSAIELGIKNPVFGVGLENFKARTIVFTTFNLTVHNAFLQIFSELGVLAFGFFIAIISYNIRLIRDLMRQEDVETARVGMFLMLQHVAVLFNAMFIPVAYFQVLWYALALPSLAHCAYRPPPTSGRK